VTSYDNDWRCSVFSRTELRVFVCPMKYRPMNYSLTFIRVSLARKFVWEGDRWCLTTQTEQSAKDFLQSTPLAWHSSSSWISSCCITDHPSQRIGAGFILEKNTTPHTSKPRRFQFGSLWLHHRIRQYHALVHRSCIHNGYHFVKLSLLHDCYNNNSL